MLAMDETMNLVDGVKVAAFPILVAVVIHYGSRLVKELKELQETQKQMLIAQAKYEGIMEGKISSLLVEIHSLKERVDNIEKKH
jgi:hypothetical protein